MSDFPLMYNNSALPNVVASDASGFKHRLFHTPTKPEKDTARAIKSLTVTERSHNEIEKKEL